MNSHVNPAALAPPLAPEDPDLALLLSSMRALTSQYRLFAQQLDSIGVALVAGKIGPEAAREWLQELGLWDAMPMLCILEREAEV